MKKFLTALLVSFAVALPACWIDGTGEKHLYGTEAKFRIDGQVVDGTVTVALPATVEILVERFDESRPLTGAALQYWDTTLGRWETLREIDRVPEVGEFAPIFGIDTLTPEKFTESSTRIRVYLTDGLTQTFDLKDTNGGFSIIFSSNRRPRYEE